MVTLLTLLQNWLPVICSALAGGLTVFFFYKFYRKKIFASYSHVDSDLVEKHWRIYRVADIDLIRDFTHISPGEDVWEGIYKLIRKSNFFIIFWSSNTVGNENVAREWKYALSLKRKRFVRTIILDETSVEFLPEELKSPFLTKSTNWERVRKLSPIVSIFLAFFVIVGVMAATYFITKKVQDYFSVTKIVSQEDEEGNREDKNNPPKPPEPPPSESPIPPTLPKSTQPFQPLKIKPLLLNKTKSVIPLPKPTPTPDSALAPIIDYFSVVLDEDGKTTNDFDPNKSYEYESEFRLVWKVINAKSVKITPHIIDISPDDGEIGIGIVPKTTTTYTLEAKGINGQTVTKIVTVNIEKGGGPIVSLILPKETPNVSSSPISTPIPPKSETTPTPMPTPFIDLLKESEPSPTKIYFEAEPLTEKEIVENQKDNLNSPPYGKICYEVSNVWWAKISPQIGEIFRGYSKRCKNIYLHRLIVGKKNVFTLEANGWELDPTASFGTRNKIFKKEVFFDLTGLKPNLGVSYTINKNESCFTPKYVRYLIIKVFEPQNESFKPDRIIAKINPQNNQEVCVSEKKDSRIDVTYVGVNGNSGTLPN